MGVGRVPGYPDYTTSGANKNIPWIFSRKTLVKFYKTSVLPAISNTEYEGMIKGLGDKVIIRTRPDVTISNYVKGATVNYETLESAAVELDIDKAKMFAFKMDKVDIKQFDIDMMNECSQDAAEQMSIVIDADPLNTIYADAHASNKGATAGKASSSFNLGVTGTPITLTKANVLDYILHCQTVLQEQNIPDGQRWMVIPAVMANIIQRSDLKNVDMTGDAVTPIRNGRLGTIGKFTLYESNNYTSVSDSGKTCYNILFGHKSALTFASQLIETEYFEKLETTFGSAMKGLNVYGYKVVKPDSLGVLYAEINIG